MPPCCCRHELAGKLSAAVRLPTISYDYEDESPGVEEKRLEGLENILKLHSFLEENYPLVHKNLERTVIADYSLLFVWKGRNETLRPFGLCAHMDVVPTPNEAKWDVKPFDGTIKDGYVWGRGSIDDKQAVLGILEACEHLLEQGFEPQRSVYLMFGHDEEIGGTKGARSIAAHLMSQGVNFEFILDEGLFVVKGLVPGHKNPVAMICTTEKGSLTMELSVEARPGHSSTPDTESAIGILANAVSKLEKNPLPAYFGKSVEKDFFSYCADGMPFFLRMIVVNKWLFGGLMKTVLASKPTTAVLVRTTTAVTIFKAGSKDNVIPGVARAVVNHRIHPGDKVDEVVAYDRRIINDARVQFKELNRLEAAPVSDHNSRAYRTIAGCARVRAQVERANRN